MRAAGNRPPGTHAPTADAVQDRLHDNVGIGGDAGWGECWRDLILTYGPYGRQCTRTTHDYCRASQELVRPTWGNLAVTALERDAQLPELNFRILEEGRHALTDVTKVLVATFLALGRGRTHEGTAAQLQIGPAQVVLAVNDEELLLDARVAVHGRVALVARRTEQVEHFAVQRNGAPQ